MVLPSIAEVAESTHDIFLVICMHIDKRETNNEENMHNFLEVSIASVVDIEVTTGERESLMHEVFKEPVLLLELTIAEVVGAAIPFMRNS